MPLSRSNLALGLTVLLLACEGVLGPSGLPSDPTPPPADPGPGPTPDPPAKPDEPPPADAGEPAPSPSPGPPQPGPDPMPDDDAGYCVEVINEHRATLSLPPLSRSTEIEDFAMEGAQQDSQSGFAHGHFSSSGGGGVAWAENEIPGWPLDWYDSVRTVIEEGTQAMWDEGPGGGHYENLTGDYTEVGCGVYVTGGNEVWVTQDFR